METINKQTAQNFRKSFEAKMLELQDEYGFQIDMNKITFTPSSQTMSFKVECKAKEVNGKSFEQNEWDIYCSRFGLKKEWFGQIVVIKNQHFKIIGINKTKPKNCVSVMQIIGGKVSDKKFMTSAITIISKMNSMETL